MTYYSKGVSGNLDQGDILSPVQLSTYLPWWEKDSNLPLVIVTPTCDLAQEKAEFHSLCVLQPLPLLLYILGKASGLLREHWDGVTPVPKGKWEKIQEKLRNTIKNAWPRYHFFPSEEGVFETDYFVDFEIIVTIPLSDLQANQRYVRLNAPYQQELIQRLTSHLMRIGTPDIPSGSIQSKIDTCVRNAGLQIAK